MFASMKKTPVIYYYRPGIADQTLNTVGWAVSHSAGILIDH